MGTKPPQGEPMVLVPYALIQLAEKVAFYGGTNNDSALAVYSFRLEKALGAWRAGPNGVPK